MLNDTYEIVRWPEIQDLMDIEGFMENAFLINDGRGMEEFGSSAYFVSSEWLRRHTEPQFLPAGGYSEQANNVCERMFEDLKSKMRSLGLATLRLEGRETVFVYDFDSTPFYRGVIEMEVFGVTLHDDMVFLRLEPYSTSVKFVNAVVTSASVPEGFDPDGDDWLPVNADILDGHSLLNIDAALSEALENAEKKIHP